MGQEEEKGGRRTQPGGTALELRAKFKWYTPLTHWWPRALVEWRGRWLTRMVSPPLCGMIATGQKQIENLAIRDWVAWGSQGYLVVAFYQGSKILKDLDKYVPPG